MADDHFRPTEFREYSESLARSFEFILGYLEQKAEADYHISPERSSYEYDITELLQDHPEFAAAKPALSFLSQSYEESMRVYQAMVGTHLTGPDIYYPRVTLLNQSMSDRISQETHHFISARFPVMGIVAVNLPSLIEQIRGSATQDELENYVVNILQTEFLNYVIDLNRTEEWTDPQTLQFGAKTIHFPSLEQHPDFQPYNHRDEKYIRGGMAMTATVHIPQETRDEHISEVRIQSTVDDSILAVSSHLHNNIRYHNEVHNPKDERSLVIRSRTLETIRRSILQFGQNPRAAERIFNELTLTMPVPVVLRRNTILDMFRQGGYTLDPKAPIPQTISLVVGEKVHNPYIFSFYLTDTLTDEDTDIDRLKGAVLGLFHAMQPYFVEIERTILTSPVSLSEATKQHIGQVNPADRAKWNELLNYIKKFERICANPVEVTQLQPLRSLIKELSPIAWERLTTMSDPHTNN